jgi:diacylglycerol kinase family enzyme
MALLEKPALIEVVVPGQTAVGELVLFGNGRLYGGNYRLFPDADLCDGLVDVCVFPKAGWMTLLRCGPAVLVRGLLPENAVRRLRARSVTFRSASRVPFELDGELAGCLPMTLTVQPKALRVVTV